MRTKEPLTKAVKALHQVRQQMDWTVAETEAARKSELEADGRLAGPLNAPALARAAAVVTSSGLSPAEQRFANNLGQLIVGLACDAFHQTERQALGSDAARIAAAVAVAMAIVNPPAAPTNGPANVEVATPTAGLRLAERRVG